ncbi:integrase core domain-containing protein [Fundicoccus sp. Sow4_H7]|uniref:integrase core domain-containing protein n=1 Tax=Fundicoccus sp. Sow4_H7 TaxID=3438784 RepID=UPI003F92654D
METIQTDNGAEFTYHGLSVDKLSVFEEVLGSKVIEHKRTRPYSPWQNGIVERSHRKNGKRFYQRNFHSKEELLAAHQRYVNRGNNVHRKCLNFMSPNEAGNIFNMTSSFLKRKISYTIFIF